MLQVHRQVQVIQVHHQNQVLQVRHQNQVIQVHQQIIIQLVIPLQQLKHHQLQFLP